MLSVRAIHRKSRFLVFFYVFYYVFHSTIQDFAQGIYRLRADSIPVLHPVDCVRRQPLLVDEVVFRGAGAEQGVVEGLVGNHLYHLTRF